MKKRLVSLKKQRESSSEDEDSDVERNFTLLTARRQTEEEEQHHGGGEEEEESDGGDEDEEGSDGGDETESDDDGEAKGDEDEDGSDEEAEGDEDEDGSDEEAEGDEDEDGSSGASEIEEGDNEAERAGGSHDGQTKEAIRKELSSMSFEDIERLQNTVGTKVYNEVAYGSSKTQEARAKKRLNKNRPMEISAKRPAPFLRQVVPVRKPTLRDPRFDDLSGEYNPEIFEKTYKFINDIRHREKEVIQKKLKKIKKSSQRKEKLQFLLKRMDNQERARKSREQQRERELQLKRQQRERAGQGGQPFFFKKSDVKKLQLAEKYQDLKKSGKLENFLSKKRKRNATKDRRKLPRQLQGEKASGR